MGGPAEKGEGKAERWTHATVGGGWSGRSSLCLCAGGVFFIFYLLSISFLSQAEATDFSFERRDWTSVGGGVGSVQAGDMDNDEDIDIVGVGGNNIYIYANEGNSGNWTRYGDLDSTGESGLNGSELFDVDGDGDLDIVGARYTRDLGWWENPGPPLTNTPWSFHPFATGHDGWYLHDMIAADLDLDGVEEEFLCVLQHGYWDGPFHIFWYRPGGDPLESWEKHVVTLNQAGPANNHAGIDAGDIDGDGDVDLSFSNGWFESAGDPKGTWTWHKVTDIYGVSNSLARDMDGDEDLDLVVSAGHHGQGLYWFENDGAPALGGWTRHDVSSLRGDVFSRHRYGAPEDGSDHLHHPEGLQVHDLDADGDPDILVSELFFGEDAGEPGWDEQEHNLYIFENLGGSPPLWRKQNISPDSWPSHIPSLVDIDGDGRMDIITEGPRINNISYLRNVTPSAAARPPWPDAVHLGDSWWASWIGTLWDGSFPWIYHEAFGWLLVSGSDPDGLWLWNSDHGEWWWTGRGLHPYFYFAGNGGWFWYVPDSSDPAWFYDLTADEWISR